MSKLEHALGYLKPVIASRHVSPFVLVICGSGLSELSNSVDEKDKLVVEYSAIPGFPRVSVAGHAGEMVFGKVSGIECMILRGRFHSYEGHSMEDCVLPVRLAHHLGCKVMLVTNACGGINRELSVGDIAIITDHIGFPLLAGKGPLVGPNDPLLGPRFPAMSNAYDERLRLLAIRAAEDLGMSDFLRTKATYAFVSGPAYETAAESAMLRLLGADLVGMSTVPEVVAAKHCGMRILGLSLVTNKVVLPGDVAPVHATHEEVLETTKHRTKDMQRLVQTILFSLKASEAEQEVRPGHGQPVAVVTPSQVAPKSAAAVRQGNLMEVESRLKELNLTTMTPLDAMRVLNELKSLVG